MAFAERNFVPPIRLRLYIRMLVYAYVCIYIYVCSCRLIRVCRAQLRASYTSAFTYTVCSYTPLIRMHYIHRMHYIYTLTRMLSYTPLIRMHYIYRMHSVHTNAHPIKYIITQTRILSNTSTRRRRSERANMRLASAVTRLLRRSMMAASAAPATRFFSFLFLFSFFLSLLTTASYVLII